MPKRAECIAFANHKGGTGKTSSCLSIAGHLARNGAKVLVVDFDPQANATSGMGIDTAVLQHSIYDAVLAQCDGYQGLPVTQVVMDTDVAGLHVVPSELDLAAAEVIMQHTGNRTGILKRTLEEVRPLYHYILIDLPPSAGLLTINGLCASDQVVVLLEPSIFSLETLGNLRTVFGDIRRMAGCPINRVTVVLNRYLRRSIFSRVFNRCSPSQEVEARLREMFDTVFVVPESVEIYKAQREGIPVSHYAPGSKVARAYAKIAESICSDTAKNK